MGFGIQFQFFELQLLPQLDQGRRKITRFNGELLESDTKAHGVEPTIFSPVVPTYLNDKAKDSKSEYSSPKAYHTKKNSVPLEIEAYSGASKIMASSKVFQK